MTLNREALVGWQTSCRLEGYTTSRRKKCTHESFASVSSEPSRVLRCPELGLHSILNSSAMMWPIPIKERPFIFKKINMYVWKEYEIGWIGRWGKRKNVIKIEFLEKKFNTIFKKRKRKDLSSCPLTSNWGQRL